MPVNDRSFIRILPESDGDRVGFLHTFDVEYTSKSRAFAVDEIVIGGTSLTEGRVLKDTPDNDTPTSGVVTVKLKAGFEAKSFTSGEALQVSASTIATAGANYCIYIGKQTLVGGNNATNEQNVDAEGAAYIRYAEGSQQYDAFGLSRGTTPVRLGEYLHEYDEQTEYWYDVLSGGGNLLYISNESLVRLQCGTASGDLVRRTTHKYHQFSMGASLLVNMTVVIGDTGKANVRRRWGYMDAENGVYFELDGTTLYTVLRSNVTGSVVETRVAQSAWSQDRVDGTSGENNLSRMTLDTSKINIYWIDLQGAGAGRVRFGVFDNDGSRVICHVLENSNTNSTAFMATSSLPVTIEQENTGVAGSTSELKIAAAAVFSEGDFTNEQDSWHNMHTNTKRNVAISSSEVPILSIRSKKLVASSVTNRLGSIPENVALRVTGDDIIFRVTRNAVLTSASYASTTGAVDIDSSAGSMSGGENILTFYFASGIHNIEIDEHFNYRGDYLRLDANGSAIKAYTYSAECFDASANVDITIGWYDFRNF